MSSLTLSPDQQTAFNAITDWAEVNRGYRFDGEYEEVPLFRMGGLAGSGKTTLVGLFAKSTRLLVAYVAPTGRAASVLARKFKAAGLGSTSKTQLPEGQKLRGRAAEVCYSEGSAESRMPFVGTIHRLIYRPVVDPQTEELQGWARRTKADRKYHLIVVDEASMVGDDVLGDLRTLGIPILAVGDHGQLPPVMSAGNLMKEPDIRLEKIHRQAEGNPIIALAHHIRNGGLLREFRKGKKEAGDKITFCNKPEINRVLEESMVEADLETAVICWTNRMRVRLNAMARTALNYKGPPRRGEIVIALKNLPPICNGMRAILKDDARQGTMPWWLEFHADFVNDELSQAVVACAPQFGREKSYGSVEELRERGIDVRTMSAAGALFDFGYAMTCHKMQGSQAAHVIVYLDRPEEPDSDDYRRWMYTAVTRSSDRLTVLR